MSQTCFSLFGETFCATTPTDQEAGVILILTVCLIAGKMMRSRNL